MCLINICSRDVVSGSPSEQSILPCQVVNGGYRKAWPARLILRLMVSLRSFYTGVLKTVTYHNSTPPAAQKSCNTAEAEQGGGGNRAVRRVGKEAGECAEN